MNQYVVDLIQADLDHQQLPIETIDKGIALAKSASPKQKKILQKASKVIDEIEPLLVPPVAKNIPRESNGLCKLHGTPLDANGFCLQKGCKFGRK